ncbi:aldehyde dehydrogenase family protein [Nonomuraea sp. NPDC050556]|uniref:aldehyde dehydrogenase family protein n=1 Tax=Nonomuraea sp. NPDC050556 TaxID=3364369 RepID=UPI0037B6F9A3
MTSGADLDAMLDRARAAQREVERWPQHRVDSMVAAAGWQVYETGNARQLAELAHAETGLGDPEHLYALHRRRVLGAMRDLHGVVTCGLISENPDKQLRRYAKPVGVIAVASPATAPSSGIAGNALPMLKTRNAVVFSPNPRARRAATKTVALLREGLRQVGAPVDLVQCLDTVDKTSTAKLMASADLVVAVGGGGTVRRAYESGTPAISAGAGNPTVIVDESAHLAQAADQIIYGGTYNNGTSCSSESNVLVHSSVAAALLEEFAGLGGYICDEAETERVRAVLWPDGRGLNRHAVGRSAREIAADADIALPDSGKAIGLVCRGGRLPTLPIDPLYGEKLSPVLTVIEYGQFDHALDAVEELLERCGRGHSTGIYTTRPDRVVALAERARASRVMVNQSTAVGNSGSFANGMPFTSTIASGTWGGCSRSENVTWRDFVNITAVSMPMPEVIPSEAEIFGAHWRTKGF